MYTINDDATLLINIDKALTESSKESLILALNHYINVLVNELGENLVSVILHGSLCAGDFDIKTSDIDLIVTTQTELSLNDFYVMSHIHNALKVHAPEWGKRFEISYITHDELYTLAPPVHPRIYLNGGHTKQETYGAEWYFEKNTICISGLSIYGQPLIREKLSVTSTKLRIAAFQILMEWWKPIVNRGMHHLSDVYLTYAVLSMCRIIMTIEKGINGTKFEAAQSVLDNKLTGYEDLIQHVIDFKSVDEEYKSKAIDFIKETVDTYLRDYL